MQVFRNYINLEMIGDRLQRNKLMKDLTYEAIVDYAGDFLTITGIDGLFEDREVILQVHDHKALLPCDFLYEIQVCIRRHHE